MDRDLNFYLDQAKNVAKISTDAELGKILNKQKSHMGHFRNGRGFPTDEDMIKIAELAGINKAQALIDLHVWKTRSSEAQGLYKEILNKIVVGSAFLLAMLPVPAFASTLITTLVPATSSPLWSGAFGVGCYILWKI